MRSIQLICATSALVLVLAGCTVSEQNLQPIPGAVDQSGMAAQSANDPFSTLDPATNAITPANTTSANGASAAPNAVPAALSPDQIRGRIRFMPVIGAPINAVTPLSRQLAVAAHNQGLQILSASDQGGDNILKGYFSAENFEGKTTVYYVWDVLDTQGTRLHRIQGQDSFPAAPGADPWTSVPASLMQKIATDSIAQYAAWRGL